MKFDDLKELGNENAVKVGSTVVSLVRRHALKQEANPILGLYPPFVPFYAQLFNFSFCLFSCPYLYVHIISSSCFPHIF